MDHNFDIISSVDVEKFSPFESFTSVPITGDKVSIKDHRKPAPVISDKHRDQMDMKGAYLEDNNGRIYPLKIGVIGKGEPADVRIMTSNYISREHARLSVVDGNTFIQDLDSRNGTFVNGIRIMGDGRIAIKTGDSITLGDTDFSVRSRKEDDGNIPV